MSSSRGLLGLGGLSGRAVLLPQQRQFHLSCGNNQQINTKRHPVPTWNRFQILEMAKPILPRGERTTQNIWKNCPKIDEFAKKSEEETLDQLDYLYSQQLRQHLDQSQMVAFFHGNSIKSLNRRKNFQNARRCKLELKGYSIPVSEEALKGSEYEAMTHFTRGSCHECWFVFSDEVAPENLLKFTKKSADLIFLGVAVHGRILDKSQLTKLTTMPSIETLHGELSTLLQMPLMRTTQLLSSGAQNLSINLEQYVKDQSPPSHENDGDKSDA